MPKILIVDDNKEILSTNHEYLTGRGFDVTCAETGMKAITYINENSFDCIVLDVLLPDLDGFAICKAARTVTNTPILFLSCLEETDDKLKGLNSGGDDYMTKPYSLKELTARIYALLRRNSGSIAVRNEDFYIDKENKMLHTPQKNIFLSQKEFDLFLLFYENPDTVFSKETLFELLWTENVRSTDTKAVAVHILRLRRKLEFAKQYIGTIDSDYGSGYRLKPPETENAISSEKTNSTEGTP